ncbi:MAG: dTDP-4-dehydrorhamnose 3,5-epimerase [Alphaproteobacteria bacterium]|nr:dTDP-4-dehydrorhamnose 3,5-epimerase [Alphaproteobacteria bacterium]
MVGIERLSIPGPLLVQTRRFEDARGFFTETYNARAFAEAGIPSVFVQDNHSLSREKGTVRGLHFQRPPHAQEKLVRVAKGRILDVVVDIRKGSPRYGNHVAVELTDNDGRQLYVPEGFAHGFCTLVPDTEVIYKVTDFWSPDCEDGVLWNDPALAIAWPDFAGAQLAAKDVALAPLSKLDSPFVLGRE